MLTSKTVFVLGAGASVPFKFPTGSLLSEEIVRSLNEGQIGYFHLTHTKAFLGNEVDQFRQTFFSSGKNSIDSFLEHRPEFLAIGKAAIAATLIPYEVPDNIFTYDGRNWLRYLFNQLSTTFDDFKNNKLSIVTFNYDRVVEFFFYTSLWNAYGKTQAECIELMKGIPIIHLHGRLGYLPWEGKGGRAFRPDVNDEALKACVDNLKIIHEDIQDGRDAEFNTAKELLSKADQIYFMGFGFNRTNVERLDIANLTPGKSWASAIGLSAPELTYLQKMCDGKVSFQMNQDCIGMCREIINWA